MPDMPRPKLAHLHREVTRHGKTVWYVRVGKGPRIRLHADYGTAAFDAEYQAALAGQPAPRQRESAGTLAWLIARYRETTAWAALSRATQRQRENIFKQAISGAGQQPLARITPTVILACREHRAATPAQARNFLDAMRGLFRWALEAKHVAADPTIGVRNPPRRGGDGFRPWTEDDVAAYHRRWPLGTRQRVWLDVLLYSGLRRGDAVRYGRQHVRDGVGRIKTEKSGGKVTAVVPMLPVLAATLEAGPCGDLTYIAGERGQPLTKESFGNLFRDACRAAGVPGSAHGVRKIAATTAANNGATVAQLKALFGWTSDSMAALYTKGADREKLAREAGHLIGNEARNSIPAPSPQVRERERKTK